MILSRAAKIIQCGGCFIGVMAMCDSHISLFLVKAEHQHKAKCNGDLP
ncbi:MAG: hypothetical protein U0M15_08820 [Bacillota bacterium]|nr:hypothetical protein [Bacillota bacterium]